MKAVKGFGDCRVTFATENAFITDWYNKSHNIVNKYNKVL